MERVVEKVVIDPGNLGASSAAILEAWKRSLVLHIQPSAPLADVRGFYDALLPRMGTPRNFAEDVRAGSREVQRTGELWMEVRFDPAFPDAYRHSSSAQPLHTDGSYIASYSNATLMCCVASAPRGGETVFISGSDLVAALGDENPKLLDELKRVPIPHARSGDSRTYPVIRNHAGRILLNWNYYCVAANDSDVQDLRERFFEYLRDSPRVRAAIVPVTLRPSDAVVWHDECVLHGRNSFEANQASARFLWKCAVDVGVHAADADQRAAGHA